MNTWIEINRQTGIEKRELTPSKDGSTATATGACPGCSATPFRVRGGNPEHMTDNRTIRAEGHSMCCGDPVGYLFAIKETLFGLEEDQVVLHGRPRVY